MRSDPDLAPIGPREPSTDRPVSLYRKARDRLTTARRRALLRAARAAVAALAAHDVRALVFGSPARGDGGAHSDLDLLVVDCPDGWRYRIETLVEAAAAGLPFDVVYADELAEPWRSAALAEAVAIERLLAGTEVTGP